MSISLNSNISSTRAQRALGRITVDVRNVYERLSSGQRINKASDDAAGLAIASSLSADGRVFSQGIRNLNDGISLLSLADGALEQLSSIVTRLKELSEQAANGTYGSQQRKALDGEAQALSKEYIRIARSTTFNGLVLLSGETGEIRLQGGYGANGAISSSLGGTVGSGTFGATTSIAAESSRAKDVALGDLNGDGLLDLISTGTAASGVTDLISIRMGLGNGSFGAMATYAAGGDTASIALGDVNGDGILDVVTAGQANGSYVRLGRGDGTLNAAVSYADTSFWSEAVALADLNNDGILDLASAGVDTSASGDGFIKIRLGRGDGTFAAARSYATESYESHGVKFGDLNRDGILDLVTAGENDGPSAGFATTRLGRGDGTFGSANAIDLGMISALDVVLGDVNGDGLLDMLTSGYYVNSSAPGDPYPVGAATVSLGRGDGTFGSVTSYTVPLVGGGEQPTPYRAISLGDFNGDGILDFVTAGSHSVYGGIANVQIGVGNGTFGSAATYLSDDGGSRAVVVGDLNGDGVEDIVTAGYTNSSNTGTLSAMISVTKGGVHPLLSFSLTTRAGALQAMSQFDQKLQSLGRQRGTIGAFQSRISVATGLAQVSTENFGTAASRIIDADVAEESAALFRTQILQQAAGAVLAQANQQPALALQLLNR